ncbi:Orotidine-5'-phosphate decarboxylase [Elusimicrobium minutum Pei191]|uniref:Orotidine 5'-phosphate decarboxylase n=1 Tax=Elusimicrobium minutum (strain Pei191) TaxID=445932 RepID=B2KCN9_ELUMP|nr:orotidine-5'-phosphate decarboxylase [Elusimicrobium minutum]ACC98285.1 Orotidine-5'-phosphate decarboxylase [Elusimicrobium minutum Pei191]
MKPYEKIIVALDVDTEKKALALVKKLKNKAGVFKIGKELFTSAGPGIVKKVQKLGGKVFLDLKFHDIPNTVYKAVASASKLGVYMMTIHTSGGSEMMKAAVKAAEENSTKNKRPIILGVTILTSLDDNALDEIGYKQGAEKMVLHLAKMAKKAGVTGIVSSPKELKKLRKALGPGMVLVTPGIRPVWSAAGDQKRITTPADAVKNGASFMVIGRPITGAKDPAKAAQMISDEIK